MSNTYLMIIFIGSMLIGLVPLLASLIILNYPGKNPRKTKRKIYGIIKKIRNKLHLK